MAPRFYVPEARHEGTTLLLPEDEASHLTRVLRLSTGDHIRVFNGRGEEWDARVDEAGAQRVAVRLVTRAATVPEPRVAMSLAVAILKGDKMDAIVRDAVMLGVSAILPIVTSRTERSLAAVEKSGRIARWQRIAISSAKQCGRAFVPEVRVATSFAAAMHAAEDCVMLVEPAAAQQALRLRDLPARERVTLFVGPEGGWTAGELQQARDANVQLLTFGAQTLRADAVPIVALTAIRVHLEDF